MAQDKKPGETRHSDDGKTPNRFDQMISSKLRSFYDGIVEEGTPDGLMDLLEKLDAAEQAAAKRGK